NPALLGRPAARYIGHGLGTFFFGELSPPLGVLFQVFGVYLAGAGVFPAVTVFLGTRRGTRRTAGHAASVGSVPASALLVLQLFDDLVEAGDDLLLNLLGPGAAARQLQPALDVVHLAGDATQPAKDVRLTPLLHVEHH